MRYRKLDSNLDYTIGSGADFHVDTPDAVAQAVLTRLKLWEGEWFLDSEEGTPYNADVLGPVHSQNADAAIRNRVLDTPGVLAIAGYASTRDPTTRALQVTITVDTVYGTATVATGVPLL